MTDQYAVIGNPIGHTKSPLIHGLFAEATGQAMSYVALEGPLTPEDGFERVVREFAAGGGKGMNVTAPFKLKAYALADELAKGPSIAHCITKKQLYAEWNVTLDEALEMEAQAQARCMDTNDFRRAYAAFSAKEKPVFKGD